MISKKITKSGGITIPKTVRADVGIHPGTAVDVRTEGNSLVITPHVPTCRFCGCVEAVETVLGIEICCECAEEIAKAVK